MSVETQERRTVQSESISTEWLRNPEKPFDELVQERLAAGLPIAPRPKDILHLCGVMRLGRIEYQIFFVVSRCMTAKRALYFFRLKNGIYARFECGFRFDRYDLAERKGFPHFLHFTPSPYSSGISIPQYGERKLRRY